MKRQLILLRHAKSSWSDPSIPDRERPLSKRGRNAVAMMRHTIRTWVPAPDLVLVSPARRTMETLEALLPMESSPPVRAVEALYLASAPCMLEILREIGEPVRSILLIGHNPGLQDLATLLIGRNALKSGKGLGQRLAEKFPTCALAGFTLACRWSQIDEAVGTLTRFVTPRDLKATD
jgi:phosphohistidine phosphatase